jgi:histidinol dehydrogenase
MRPVEWSSLTRSQRTAALARPTMRRDERIVAFVERVFADVEARGKDAVHAWAVEVDKAAPQTLELNTTEVDRARAQLEAEDLAALELAMANITTYHEATAPRETSVSLRQGLTCVRAWRPIPACGLYVPGGSAPLFSTLYMLAIPARVAGVPVIEAMTPPNRDGAIHPMMIAAAALAGIERLQVLGGAQAIAALTFGAGVAKADKVFGPGNAYVTEAKRLAAALPGGPQIDTPAGPSELMVIADSQARADIVAADLLSQAEHDADAQVVLVATDSALAQAIVSELEHQVTSLPRAAIARASLDQARIFIARDTSEAVDIANAYAAEHLILNVDEPSTLAARITNAGAIFIGSFSAESFGDYLAGPSHVLPTDGAARAWSGVSVASFMKSMSIQSLDAKAAAELAPVAARLARLEGLEAHARAAGLRASA